MSRTLPIMTALQIVLAVCVGSRSVVAQEADEAIVGLADAPDRGRRRG